MPSLPAPLRAAIGLAAVAAENAKYLPEKAVELPMLAVSTALQLSLRAQQQYAALTVRGDEVLAGQEPTEEVASWAIFDDPPPPPGADASEPGDEPQEDDPASGDPAESDADESGEPAGTGDAGPRPAGTTPDDADPPPKRVRPRRDATPSRFDAVDD